MLRLSHCKNFQIIVMPAEEKQRAGIQWLYLGKTLDSRFRGNDDMI